MPARETPWSRERRWRASEGTPAERAHAARVLALRSRRAAASLYAGGWASAFRGAGIEFDELRPYAPGDDVRSLDWNATARRGEPHVRRFREERDQVLWLLLDVSASMEFGSTGRAKAAVAAHAASLLAAAASHAGDRVGLVAFADGVRAALPPARGEAHVWRLVETAVEAAEACGGATDLDAAVRHLHAAGQPRGVACLLSDLRDPGALPPGGRAAGAPLAALGRRHDLVSLVVSDPREEALPVAGRVRIRDPERPGRTAVLDTGRRRVRQRFAAAAAARRRDVERRVRALGADCAWLRTDRDPLGALLELVRRRGAARRAA